MPFFRGTVVEVGGQRYRVCIYSKSRAYVEYRPEPKHDRFWFIVLRGNTRIFQSDKNTLSAVPISGTVTGDGDLTCYESGPPRPATEFERMIFQSVMR